MFPAMNIRFSIPSCVIPDGQINDSQIQSDRSEEEVEVAERISLQLGSMLLDFDVVCPHQSLRATESVFDGLAQQPSESETKKLVGDHVQESHRLIFGRID